MPTWDETADLVIVGSGGGALVAALVAADRGLRPLIVEKQAYLGGSTAMSGGVVWMPANPLMAEDGVADSYEAGLAYLDDVVGAGGPGSSPARRRAFLRVGPEMIAYLRRRGMRFERCQGYSDYYPDHRGGNAEGRSIEGPPFDARQLGEWGPKIMPGMAKAIGLAVKTNEVRSLQYFNRSPKSFVVAGQVWLRTTIGKLRGQDLLTNGGSLVGQLVKLLVEAGVPIWTEAAMSDLVVDDGRVRGVRVRRAEREIVVEARRGVLLAAGGFARNADMRRKYSGDQPNQAEWTVANPGDTGEVMDAAMTLGAATDLLDEAWWLPSPSSALGSSTLGLARQRPGAIFVNAEGRRFCNESNSYVEVGKAMYAEHGVPCWLLFDDGYRRRYAAAKGLPGRLPERWIEDGLVHRAATVAELAVKIGIDPEALEATIACWNSGAVSGLDPDFGRGRSAYNRCLGDPGHRPNPAVGPLDRAPYYATAIYPSDVGTCGGLVTDEHARVLDEAAAPIPGLYATGNITATVMGRTYPGAGASIANTMVFGYAAAEHACS